MGGLRNQYKSQAEPQAAQPVHVGEVRHVAMQPISSQRYVGQSAPGCNGGQTKEAAAAICGWDRPSRTFTYPGFDCGSGTELTSVLLLSEDSSWDFKRHRRGSPRFTHTPASNLLLHIYESIPLLQEGLLISPSETNP